MEVDVGNLHCGRCGEELNDWAICQPCRLRDAILESQKNSFNLKNTSYEDRPFYSGPLLDCLKQTRLERIFSKLLMILGVSGVIFLLWVWWYFIIKHFV